MGWDAHRQDRSDCNKKKWLYDDDEDDEDEEDERTESECPRNLTPPDGGWGWLVMLASFMSNLIVDGICFSCGIDQREYMRQFNASHAKVSWIGSSLTGCYLLVGPFVSALCAHYGCRKVTMMGSIVTMSGFALSTQATNVETMIVCYGIIGGIGFGMIYLPAIVSVGHWFDKKRAFATGIAVGGSGFGQAIMPGLVTYLLSTYQWTGKNLIMAGIVLNCAVCGALFRPVNRWFERRRKPVNTRVEIERGVIMKALIEHKEKQRTISNGSLDDCVITRDNKLIKLDPALLNCKRDNSMLARFKRQLGFSAQSLTISKSSVQDIHNLVLDAINSSKNNSTTFLHHANNGDALGPRASMSRSSQVSTGSSTPDVHNIIYTPPPQGNSNNNNNCGGVGMSYLPSLVVNGSAVSVATTNGGMAPDHVPGFPKTRSCDALSRQAKLAEDAALYGGGSMVNGACSLMDLPSTPITRESMLDTSVISIQVVPNCVAGSRHSVRQRSSRSVCSEYTPSTAASSQPTFVSASVTTLPQMQSALDLSTRDTIGWKIWRILCNMFDLKLLLNPVFALLVFSSILTLLAFHIPYFFLPEQGVQIGMTVEEANFLLSIMGVTNTVGRFFGGWLADRPVVNTLHLNNVSLTLVGIVIIACPWCEDQNYLALMAALSAFFIGIFIALRSILLVELLGLDMLTKSFGMLILFQGIAALIGPPIAGRLADYTGNLSVCFTLAGTLTIMSGLLFFPIQCLHSKAKKGKEAVTVPDKPITETYCIRKMVSEA